MKQYREPFVRDTDSRVCHINTNPGTGFVFGVQVSVHLNLAPLRKLHGISRQIHENLAKSPGIALKKRGYVRVDPANYLQAFLMCPDGNHFDSLLQRMMQIEVDDFQAELPGLDFREVQNIVDEAQQSLPAHPHDLRTLALLGSQWRV